MLGINCLNGSWRFLVAGALMSLVTALCLLGCGGGSAAVVPPPPPPNSVKVYVQFSTRSGPNSVLDYQSVDIYVVRGATKADTVASILAALHSGIDAGSTHVVIPSTYAAHEVFGTSSINTTNQFMPDLQLVNGVLVNPTDADQQITARLMANLDASVGSLTQEVFLGFHR